VFLVHLISPPAVSTLSLHDALPISRVDILTGTLGKALGGGSGGYIAARREVIEWLRQRSRPYLFSNSIPPVVAAASLAVLELLRSEEHTSELQSLRHIVCRLLLEKK